MTPPPSAPIGQADLPIIPTIAQRARDHPGTISLGQGVVNDGPPLAALRARLARDHGIERGQALRSTDTVGARACPRCAVRPMAIPAGTPRAAGR